MKQNRTIVSLLLAAAFFVGSVPALACGRSCASLQPGRACAKACAGGPAAQGVKALHSACCGRLSGPSAQATALAPARAQQRLQAPNTVAAFAALPRQTLILSRQERVLDGRGPPSANPYLWSQHPFANAPPISL